MLLCALSLIVATAVALAIGINPPENESSGIFFTLKGVLIDKGPLSAAVNVLCLLAAGGLMLALNKVFSYVRTVTHLFASVFFLLMLANPSGLVALNAGSLLALVTTVTILPLFGSYQDKHSQRSIFLIFAMVSTGTMFHYGFLMLIPAFLLGFLYMGVLNLKGLLAMAFGLVTPFWIVMGLGIAGPEDFTVPSVHGLWAITGEHHVGITLIVTAVTAILGIVLALMNLMAIMNYRMQTRVYNAFFVILFIVTVIALCIDYREATVFLPLLNLMVAVQVAHIHTLRTTLHNRYFFIAILAVSCLGCYCIHAFM